MTTLLEKIRQWENQEAWLRFFHAYGPFIYRRAARRGLNDAEAQEVVQETMLGVAKKIAAYQRQPGTPFRHWLNVIITRRIHTQLARRRRSPASLDAPREGASGSPLEELADPASVEPDETWERDWQENLLRAALARVRERVRPKHFQIYEYHVLKGRDARETARDLDTTLAQVYVVKFRVGNEIKKELRRLVEAEY